ncbi:MAG: UDP-N-acetylmuramoyl-L-alanine--D-glutamate ligase [Azoarcus sp.]|nr:UDP-N-acetylmuramoyl-L-alanine--D-glutamate ligase [Azoarcus sp.]
MELAGKRFLVLGLGESGLAMAKWLHRQGGVVRVADSRENPPNREALAAVAPEIEVVGGPFRAEMFDDADYIARSPGVPISTPALAAVAGKVPVIGELDLFIDALRDIDCGAKVLAITGSNGKTTTTALTAHLLNGVGISALACGNISPSMLDALMGGLDTGNLPQVHVLELSSFQLETGPLPGCAHARFHAATVLNLSADHLDRHADMAAYREAKLAVFHGARFHVVNRDSLLPGGFSLRGVEAPQAVWYYGCQARAADARIADDLPAQGLFVEENAIWLIGGAGRKRLIGLDEIPLKGMHNAINVAAALALCATLIVELEQLLPALKTFKGLPHRVEPVAEIDGVLYVDDSKGTNVGATLAAIEGMGKPVAIVLGGDGKGQDFTPLKAALDKHGRAVALIGKDKDAIAQAIGGGLPMNAFADLETAVRWLAAQARSGDCVLLSPACASWDMFRNYAHRAEVFVGAVRALAGGRG